MLHGLPTVALEPLCAAHADELFPLLQHPELYTFTPAPAPVSLSALRDRFMRLESRRSPGGDEAWLNWVVRHDTAGAALAWVQATIRSGARATVAYTLFRPYWGQGIARSACVAMFDALRDAHAVEHLRAEIDTRNARSIRLVESLGFTRVATVQDADHFHGAPSHEHHYVRAITAA